ncbi:lamin tail domain-containing protein [Streptomyces violascens]|uniref:lamin tail domain-containing protein n=1 Tax=Streptomyces violascens TaxID=67381 RepID=UPI00368C12F9
MILVENPSTRSFVVSYSPHRPTAQPHGQVGKGSLLGAAALPAAAEDGGPRRPERGVILKAIQYGGHHHRDLNEEWVQVTNISDREENLDDYSLTDREGHTYVFHRVRLGAYQDVLVHTGHGRDDWRDVYQNADRPLYNDFRGTIILSNERGREIDDCSWEPRDRGYRDCNRR